MLMYLDYFIKDGYGSYTELINLTIKDLIEIEIAKKSKADEEKIMNAL